MIFIYIFVTQTKYWIMVQNFKKYVDNEYQRAEIYYSILSSVNDFNLTPREIQLVAFTAIKGNMSNGNVRNEFCKLHDTSVSTINNIISKLKKLQIFIKEKDKIKVNPSIVLDFKQNILIGINLINVI